MAAKDNSKPVERTFPSTSAQVLQTPNNPAKALEQFKQLKNQQYLNNHPSQSLYQTTKSQPSCSPFDGTFNINREIQPPPTPSPRLSPRISAYQLIKMFPIFKPFTLSSISKELNLLASSDEPLHFPLTNEVKPQKSNSWLPPHELVVENSSAICAEKIRTTKGTEGNKSCLAAESLLKTPDCDQTGDDDETENGEEDHPGRFGRNYTL